MSTTNPAPQPTAKAPQSTKRRQPITFAEWFVVLNGFAPLVLLMYDARMHHLGADPIRNALHTTGSLALGLLTITLAITPLRRLTGWDALVSYRRPLGLVTFFYALAHVAIYVGYDQGWKWKIAWEEICQRRYLQLGGIALVLLVPLAITSSPWWVKLLSYRRWKNLHRLIYPAAILAVAHYWVQSKADLRWQIGFVVAVGSLLLFRIVDWQRNRRNKQQPASEATAASTVTIETAPQSYVFECNPGETILDAGERNQVPLESMCRAGMCGTCKIQLINGNVKMDCEEALTDQQRDEGLILACQAICESNSVSLSMLPSPANDSQNDTSDS